MGGESNPEKRPSKEIARPVPERNLGNANSIQTNEPNEKKFSKSWRSMLCLIGLRTTMSADIDSVSTALSLLKSTRIIPIHRQHTHQHHSLFRGGIKCLKNSQIAAGLDYVTKSELCRLLESEKGANEIIQSMESNPSRRCRFVL